MRYYLAVDLGASSGRHILGHLEEGKLILEEMHRFDNNLEERNGHLCWNHEALFAEIVTGMKKCAEAGKIPITMAIDTWGVDYVLLDEEDQVIGDTVSYRDNRTFGMDDAVNELIEQEELYQRTGIQKSVINTIYQLMAQKKQAPKVLEKAKALLFTPEYFDFLLTGKKMCEYTIASTAQLLNPFKKDWDYELFDKLSLPKECLLPISVPGTVVGNLREEIKEKVGFDCEVVLAPAHDTASAVLAVPVTDDKETIYLSSGTWSLMGIERTEPDTSLKSMVHNFTNEGGYDYRFRYLKNIMGLWMIQSVRNEMADRISFAKLCELAEEADSYTGLVDVNDNRFLAPASMTTEIINALAEQGMPKPKEIGELAACIYKSLARKYSETVREIEEITGKTYDSIHIVGGGSHADYLNRLTAKETGKRVIAGPSEATAIGNLLAQMMKYGDYKSVAEARRAVYASFDIKEIVV